MKQVIAGILVVIASLFAVESAQARKRCAAEMDCKDTKVFAGARDVEGRSGLYSPFWVCVWPKQVKAKVICEDLGINEWEGPKAELQIVITGKDAVHEYGLRHAIPLMECASMRNKIRKLLKSSRQACIRGNYVWHESNLPRKQEFFSWVFFEFQTEQGHVADCEEC